MQNTEANKFMTWLLAAFPQWKVDVATTTLWASELPDVSAEEAIRGVRKIQAHRPSPFPPGVFEVIDAMQDDGQSAEEAWLQIADSTWKGDRVTKGSAKAMEVFRLLGGWGRFAKMAVDEEPFVRKEFISIFKGLKGKTIHERLALAPGRTGPGLKINRGMESMDKIMERNPVKNNG